MKKIRWYQKVKCRLFVLFIGCCYGILIIRTGFLMLPDSKKYSDRAKNIEQREREIKAARGKILDRNGVVLADNVAVCSISVIHRQITEPERVIEVLSRNLDLEETEVRKKVERVSSREKIKSNVEKSTGDKIRKEHLSGVKIDVDYKRYYPFDDFASQILGFTGADNQGIIGLESKYESILRGQDGQILTFTDSRGIEIENAAEERVEPVSGNDLTLSLDYNVECYAQMIAKKVMKEKKAKSVSIILMNPQNGEIFAMVQVPEFHLSKPFEVIKEWKKKGQSISEQQNNMWRNRLISDSYEPGSTFKIITATAALEEKKVSVSDQFFCPGYKVVDDRRIRCHKTTGHGAETFKDGVKNSCNPVFIEVGARVGAKALLKYYKKLGLYEVTGIDLPGEANSIMHPLKNIGNVELATMSFGQSIQITPVQLLRAVAAVVNGGTLVTPHFGVSYRETTTGKKKTFQYKTKQNAVTKETSETMKMLLESVVSEGGGSGAQVKGWRVGGKTATSEKLPRGTGKYISSFLGFAPTNHPTVMGILLIDEPQGLYYGGMIAAPVMGKIFENVLPYLAEQRD